MAEVKKLQEVFGNPEFIKDLKDLLSPEFIEKTKGLWKEENVVKELFNISDQGKVKEFFASKNVSVTDAEVENLAKAINLLLDKLAEADLDKVAGGISSAIGGVSVGMLSTLRSGGDVTEKVAGAIGGTVGMLAGALVGGAGGSLADDYMRGKSYGYSAKRILRDPDKAKFHAGTAAGGVAGGLAGYQGGSEAAVKLVRWFRNK